MKLYGSLDNYISTHRRHAGLSQSELALLIGIENRATVAYYEQGSRVPELNATIALEIVFGCQAKDIFAGVAEYTRELVARRAVDLLESLSDTPTKENLRKIEHLSRLAHPDELHIIPLWENTA